MIKLSSIKPNPDNPRVIKDESFDMLKKSIQDFPDMMKARPIVVDENNMVMGGNQRLKALLALGFKEVHQDWVKKITDFTKDQWQEFIIKDNVWFGNWNWNDLDKWDDDKLNDWGVETQNSVDIEVGKDGFELKSGDKAPFQQMTFTLADNQAESIKSSLKKVQTKRTKTFDNQNQNGNALYQIILEWEEQNK